MEKNSMVATNSELNTDGVSLGKFFTDFKCNSERIRNINFFKENSLFSPRINFTFYSGDLLLGYNMEFIPGCVTFKDAVADDSYTYDDKVKAINGVFSKLKKLHECDVVVGDMHAQNIMFNSQDGYIVDLDEVRFLGRDNGKFESVYRLELEDGTILDEEDFYTDNVKATVCSLSLLYGVDFEDIIHHGILKVSDLKIAINTVINDGEFKGEVLRLLSATEDVVYFDDILARQNVSKKSEVL